MIEKCRYSYWNLILLFSSKFERLSHLIEKDFRIFTDLTMLLESVRSERPVAIIINLDATKPDDVQKVVAWGIPVMGYYSHVNSEVARAAVQSGVSPVVTRGGLVANAESLVRELLNSRRPSS